MCDSNTSKVSDVIKSERSSPKAREWRPNEDLLDSPINTSFNECKGLQYIYIADRKYLAASPIANKFKQHISNQSVLKWNARVLRTGYGQNAPAHGPEPLSYPALVGGKKMYVCIVNLSI